MRTVALILVFALTGCKTAPHVVKAPEIVKVQVREIVPVPDELTKLCAIYEVKESTYGEAVTAANKRKASLEECNARMKKIRELGK